MARKLSPERRAQFLNAALKLFVENGVQGTSTAAIAREAGSAAGTLFIYFPTKQDLIDALVLQISRQQAEAVRADFDPTHSAREMFYTIWESTIRWFTAHMEAYQFIQQIRDSGIISQEVIEETAVVFDFYYITIEKGLTEGSIKPYALDLIGNILYHDLVAVTDYIRARPDTDQQQRAIEDGFTIFWDGIKQSGSWPGTGKEQQVKEQTNEL